MLNASQNLTNLAPFTEASTSNTPASTAGWFAIIPMDLPANRENPTTMFSANSLWTSKKLLGSESWRIISLIS